MSNFFIYNHGGSGNHGCEALVRTTLNLFQDKEPLLVLSDSLQQDIRYGIDDLAILKSATTAHSKNCLSFWNAYLTLKVRKDYVKMDSLPYLKQISSLSSTMTELSIGGDIYCYEDYRKFILLHDLIVKRGCKSVLLGCSLDERLFMDPEFVTDMKHYTYISARESLTYEMLKQAGLTNIGLTPDSAFTLETERLPLPDGFVEDNTIGINLSPLVVRKETSPGIVMENFLELIRWILNSTDCSVALIPHVVWQNNDDRTVLQQLYDTINCPERVVLIGDHNCKQLKGFISRCRFFVGTRTHATIAAYSTCVPTLVLGYSIKSRGIAKDLFGTDQNYVLPVQQLTSHDALTHAFNWLISHEQDIRSHLVSVIPDYIASAKQLPKRVTAVLEKI